MFFFGGFNSVMPYLLYLSLVWVFLLIEGHGKVLHIKLFGNSSELQATNLIIQTDQCYDYFLQDIVYSNDETHEADTRFFNNWIACIYVEPFKPINTPAYQILIWDTNPFRGPPPFFL